MLGISTGGRVSELLSFQIADVYQNGSAVSDLLFEKSIVKGGEVSRAVPVNADGRLAIDELVDWHCQHYKNHLLYNSLKTIDDKTLFLELARRGYDPSRRREDEATGEVVKIG